MCVVGHLKTNFAQKCHLIDAVYVQNEISVSLQLSVKLYHLILHIMS